MVDQEVTIPRTQVAISWINVLWHLRLQEEASQ